MNNALEKIKSNTLTLSKTMPTLCSLFCLMAAATVAQAEESKDKVIEEIVVVGQAASLRNSLAKKRNADHISDTVNADKIGQFPDDNVTEALQRLPGVSIELDQGEGRFVRIRGLSKELNSVSVNGLRLPSPESDTRAVALDVVPSDLLETLEVRKSLTPDMDGDGIGGSIEVKSLSAFDRNDKFYKVSAESTYDQHTGETNPKLSFTSANKYDLGDGYDNFGMAFSTSWYERDFGTDNVENSGSWNFDGDDAYMENIEARKYLINRKRLGMALNFDYRPSADSELYLRTLYSKFGDQEFRHRAELEFADDGALDGVATTAEIKRDLKDRFEEQEIISFNFGGGKTFDAWKAEFNMGYSEASEDQPYEYETEFKAELDGVGFNNNRQPVIFGGDDYFSGDSYELDKVGYEVSFTKDTSTSFQMDFTRETEFGDHPSQLKFGGKMMRREKMANMDVYKFKDFDELDGVTDSDLLLSQHMNGTVDYGFGPYGPAIDTTQAYAWLQQMDQQDFLEEEDSRIDDYTIEEDINAMYAMARIDMGDVRLVGGLRYETTSVHSIGTLYVEDTDEEFQSVEVDKDYNHLLPSMNLRWEVTEDSIFRVAFAESVMRPNFQESRPGALINEDNEAELGNPLLEPVEASNFDVAMTWYNYGGSTISVGLFYKDIKNFIYETDLAGTGSFVDYDEATIAVNGDSASVYGAEFSFSQEFDNGFLLLGNLTLTDSDANYTWAEDGVLMSRSSVMPGQSDTSANFAIGYEDNIVDIRLAASYKSGFLKEVQDVSDSSMDIHEDDYLALDLTARYNITDRVQIFFKAKNLLNEKVYAYTGNRAYIAQYDDNGATFSLGVQMLSF